MLKLQTIKIYSPTELETVIDLAKLGFDMAAVAQHLDITFTRFWMDYNNPALYLREAYDEGIREGEKVNREHMIKAAQKSESAQKNVSEEIQAAKIRNKLSEIRANRKNPDL